MGFENERNGELNWISLVCYSRAKLIEGTRLNALRNARDVQFSSWTSRLTAPPLRVVQRKQSKQEISLVTLLGRLQG